MEPPKFKKPVISNDDYEAHDQKGMEEDIDNANREMIEDAAYDAKDASDTFAQNEEDFIQEGFED